MHLHPETQFLALIDEAIFNDCYGVGFKIEGRKEPWRGKAERLQSLLFDSTFHYEAKKLLHWTAAAGTYLGRLEAKRSDRVQRDRSSDERNWIILPPPKSAAA
jgi:hypothetical protein